MKKFLTLLIFFSVVNIYSQSEFQKNITGKWKLEKIYQKTSFLDFGKYLKILDNEIHFYNLIDGKESNEVVKKFYYLYYEKHTDTCINKDSCQVIKFENGEIWLLHLRIINNETRLIFDLKIDEEGNYWGIGADDRGIIRDPIKRKKALEGEVNTYYIKYY